MFEIYIYNLGTYQTTYCTITNLDELEDAIFEATNHGMNDYEVGILEYPYDFKVNDLHSLFKISEEYKTRIEDVGILLQCFSESEVIEVLEQGIFYTVIESDSKISAFEDYANDYDIIEIPSHLENYIDYECMMRDWEYGGLLIQHIGSGKYLISNKW